MAAASSKRAKARPRGARCSTSRSATRRGSHRHAWAEFTEALGIAKKDDRPQRIELAQTTSSIEPTLSRLVIQVPELADAPDLEIKRDAVSFAAPPGAPPCPSIPVSTSSRLRSGQDHVEALGRGRCEADIKTVSVPTLENAPTLLPPRCRLRIRR